MNTKLISVFIAVNSGMLLGYSIILANNKIELKERDKELHMPALFSFLLVMENILIIIIIGLAFCKIKKVVSSDDAIKGIWSAIRTNINANRHSIGPGNIKGISVSEMIEHKKSKSTSESAAEPIKHLLRQQSLINTTKNQNKSILSPVSETIPYIFEVKSKVKNNSSKRKFKNKSNKIKTSNNIIIGEQKIDNENDVLIKKYNTVRPGVLDIFPSLKTTNINHTDSDSL